MEGGLWVARRSEDGMASDESLMCRRLVRRIFPPRLPGVVMLYGVCVVGSIAAFAPCCCPTLAHPFMSYLGVPFYVVCRIVYGFLDVFVFLVGWYVLSVICRNPFCPGVFFWRRPR